MLHDQKEKMLLSIFLNCIRKPMNLKSRRKDIEFGGFVESDKNIYCDWVDLKNQQ